MQKVSNYADFQVFRGSAGLGLKTKKSFKKGDFVIEYIGVKKTNKEVEENTTKYLFDLDKNFTIDGSPRWNIARYINHSCVPNCESDVRKGRILISAIKNIKAGDELTYDYGKEYFDEFIKPFGCRCSKHLKKTHGRTSPSKNK
jgi:SET domain-containing protein